jgi:hypothetical protein
MWIPVSFISQGIQAHFIAPTPMSGSTPAGIKRWGRGLKNHAVKKLRFSPLILNFSP